MVPAGARRSSLWLVPEKRASAFGTKRPGLIVAGASGYGAAVRADPVSVVDRFGEAV